MSIKAQTSLPATEVLESENIFVMAHEHAISQGIRSLKIMIPNLMPTRIETKTQLLRSLDSSPLQVGVESVRMAGHFSKNTSYAHIDTFCKAFDRLKNDKFDGMITTSASVELIDFKGVDY